MKLKVEVHGVVYSGETNHTRELAEYGLRALLADGQANKRRDPDGARRRVAEIMKRHNLTIES